VGAAVSVPALLSFITNVTIAAAAAAIVEVASNYSLALRRAEAGRLRLQAETSPRRVREAFEGIARVNA
jgi:uncharacterized membrane protein YfcA